MVAAPSLYSQFGDESTTQTVQGDKSVAETYYSDSARLLVKYNELENTNHLTAPPASDAAPALALASTTIADNAAKKAGKGASMNMLVLYICFKDGYSPLPMHHLSFLESMQLRGGQLQPGLDLTGGSHFFPLFM
jgi:hypothetical protein